MKTVYNVRLEDDRLHSKHEFFKSIQVSTLQEVEIVEAVVDLLGCYASVEEIKYVGEQESQASKCEAQVCEADYTPVREAKKRR